jgi:hypothetical protein
MGSTAVMVREAGGRRSDDWGLITSLVLDGISSRHTRRANLPPVLVKLPDGTIERCHAVELPTRFDEVIQSWGMAFKDTKNSDFVVGQIHAAKGADRYLLDQTRARLDLPGTLLAVRRLSAQWPDAHLKLVEDKANGPAVIQSLRHEVGGLVSRGEPRGRQDLARSGCESTTGISKLVFAASNVEGMGRRIHSRMRSFPTWSKRRPSGRLEPRSEKTPLFSLGADRTKTTVASPVRRRICVDGLILRHPQR